MSLADEQIAMPGHSRLMSNPTAPTLQGDPAMLAAGNRRPASITVASNLAEDTIIAGVMDIKEGRNSVALFANPFVGGMEEMLYVDEKSTLRWARHVNQPVSRDDHPLGGWSVEAVASGIAEVVVVVHPTGSVWAFGVAAEPPSIKLFELVQDASVHGGLRWAVERVADLPDAPMMPSVSLWIQYLNDRPATPVVFFTESGPLALVSVLIPAIPPNPLSTDPRWQYAGFCDLGSADDVVPGLGAVGYDGPDLDALRLYTVDADRRLWRITTKPHGRVVREQVATGVTGVVGVWSASTGAGCVSVRADPKAPWLMVCYPYQDGDVSKFWTAAIQMDQLLDDIDVWQDAEARLHVYGRGADGGLHVLHQGDWMRNADTGGLEPVWDWHANTDGQPIGTTRPLFPAVARFTVDPFPDDMPSQHVMHSGVEPGESCAIYTQQVGTSYWAQEKVRLVPDILPAPYTVPRYETSLTVVDSFGNPVPFCQVSLTADAPVDLEVAGRFYRASQITPVSLLADSAGRIILRVVAMGLSVPDMHASVPGMAQAVTIQQAAGVHKFLGGAGTLPSHPDGFTAAAVSGAKKPNGDPLFPRIKRTEADAQWPPTAADVVAWCQGAFAVSSGHKLPTALSASLAPTDQVFSFSIQTHDPSRPGLQVYTSREQLDARRALLIARGASAGASDWWGDLWQGIRAGIVKVAEVAVHVVDKTWEVLVELADGAKVWFQGVWDNVVSAAHAVEAAFVALGALLREVIDYLTWSFDFKDIWETKKAFASAFAVFPPYMKATLEMLRGTGDRWFEQKEAEVTRAFESMKTSVAGRSTGALTATALPDNKQPPSQSMIKDKLHDPHVAWLSDHMTRSGEAGLTAGLPTLLGADADPFEILVGSIRNSPAWPDVSTAVQDMGKLFTNLFNFSDAQTVAAQEISTFLDLFEHVTLALLKFGDSLLNAFIDFVEAMLVLLTQILETPIDNPLLGLVYTYVQESAGVSAEQVESPTIGGLGTLIAAFPGTILYKLVWGKAPFPGGTFPHLPIEGGHGPDLDLLPAAPGGSIPPNGWGYLLTIQSYQAVMMALDGIFDVYIDGTAFYDDETMPWWLKPPQWFWVAAAVNHFVAYGFFDFPFVWGSTWPPNHPVDTTFLPYGSWILSILVNLADLGCSLKMGYFVTRFEESASGVGPFTLSIAGIARLIISGARYENAGSKSSTDLFNLWINLTSFESSATGFVRFLFKRNPELSELMGAKALVDLGCDEFAGIATQYQSAYTNSSPPRILVPVIPEGTEKEPYPNTAFQGAGGWEPYQWQMIPVEGQPPPDAVGISIDTKTGVLSGTPTAPGKFTFKVLLGDYSGPTFYYLTDEITLTVNPQPASVDSRRM